MSNGNAAKTVLIHGKTGQRKTEQDGQIFGYP